MAGTIATVSSNFVNSIIFSKLKIKMHGKYFWIRSVLSSAVGGAVLVGIIYPLHLKLRTRQNLVVENYH